MGGGIISDSTTEKYILVTSNQNSISEMISAGFKQAKNGEGRPTKEITNGIRVELSLSSKEGRKNGQTHNFMAIKG